MTAFTLKDQMENPEVKFTEEHLKFKQFNKSKHSSRLIKKIKTNITQVIFYL